MCISGIFALAFCRSCRHKSASFTEAILEKSTVRPALWRVNVLGRPTAFIKSPIVLLPWLRQAFSNWSKPTMGLLGSPYAISAIKGSWKVFSAPSIRANLVGLYSTTASPMK